MSGYETIQRSGRHVDVGGRVEHDILVDAEHKLLSSLAKARVSNAAETPLVFRKTTLRSRDDPTFQRAAFGDGAAEVRALGDSGPGGRGILRRLEGVAIMKGSRAERHEATVAAWRAERDHVAEGILNNAVQLCVSGFRDRLAASDARLSLIHI